MHHFLITCPLGLEALVKHEVQKQDFTLDEVQDKAVYFSGGLEALARMNLWSRFGNILYFIVAEQKNVTDFDTLFDIISKQDWHTYIPKDFEILVQATSIKSELGSVSSLQGLAKKAIVKKILQQNSHTTSPHPNPLPKGEGTNYKLQPHFSPWEKIVGGQSGEKGGEILTENVNLGSIEIRILLENNTLRILLNTSGNGLHKRGYREMTGDAPLKENVAAALVILSNWKFKEPLYDIFCGSGTIGIEAAMIARNIAPGLKRHFACETWSWLPKDLFESEKQRAFGKQFAGEYKIYCTDIRKDIIELAKRNAAFAGVGEDISFGTQDYTTYMRRELTGTLVSNPPYGLRLENADVPKIHGDIAELLSKNKNLGGGIITAHSEFEHYSKTKYKRRKLYNGGEQVYFYKKEQN